MAHQLEAAEAPDMPRNSTLALPAFLTAVPEPKLPIDGRAKRAMQPNGRMHVPEPPAMPNALAYPVFTLTSPPAPAAPPAAAINVTPDLGLDAGMNLGLAPARHARRPLSEVSPMEPVRHETEAVGVTVAAPVAPVALIAPVAPVVLVPAFDAGMNLALTPVRHAYHSLSEVRPMEPVRHEHESAEIATVQPGDTLWHIAQQRLGSGYRWKEIAAANPKLKNSTKILIGEQLRLPFPESFSDLRKRTHRVNSGDSLWKLARAAFGNGTAWLCLAHANPEIQNPDLLLPGQKIQIPQHCGVSAEAGNNSHAVANLAVK
jgi:nucleoid-associated protein YgaU